MPHGDPSARIQEKRNGDRRSPEHVVIDLNVHFHGLPAQASEGSTVVLAELAKLTQLLMEKIMPTMDETVTLVRSNSTRLGSLAALFASLQQQVKDALADTDPATQAKIDAIFAEATSQGATIDAALNSNVPPVVVPPADSPELIAATKAAADAAAAVVAAGADVTQEQLDEAAKTEAERTRLGGKPIDIRAARAAGTARRV